MKHELQPKSVGTKVPEAELRVLEARSAGFVITALRTSTAAQWRESGIPYVLCIEGSWEQRRPHGAKLHAYP